MKKIILLCLLAVSLRASADLVLVENLETGGTARSTTAKIKGDKIRSDVSSAGGGAIDMSTITDMTSGDMIILTPRNKEFRKRSASQALAMKKGFFLRGGATAPTAPPELVDSGKKEKVNGYDAEIYTAETPSVKFTFWVTKDYPDGAAVSGQLKKVHAMQMADNLYPDLTKLDGVVLKSEMILGPDKTVVTTIISAKIQPLDDSEFQVPADYTEAAQPNAPAPPAATGAPVPGAAAGKQ